MSENLKAPAWLTPRVRRVLGALTLGAGVLIVGRLVVPSVPREVPLRLNLSDLRDEPLRARAVIMTFAQGSERVAEVTERFGTVTPRTMERSVSLVPGRYHAVVRVELAARVLSSEADVDAAAGVVMQLPTPNVD